MPWKPIIFNLCLEDKIIGSEKVKLTMIMYNAEFQQKAITNWLKGDCGNYSQLLI